MDFEGQNPPFPFLSSDGRCGVEDEHLGDQRIGKAFFDNKLCQKLPLIILGQVRHKILTNFEGQNPPLRFPFLSSVGRCGVEDEHLGDQRIGKAFFENKLCKKLP